MDVLDQVSSLDGGEIESELRKSAVRQVRWRCARHDRGRAIGLVERILHHGERRFARRPGRDGGREVKAFAGARHRRDLSVGIDPAARRGVAPMQVPQRRPPELGRADGGGIAVPEVRMGRHRFGQERRRRVLRLAHRHDDRRQFRIGHDAREQFVEPAKRRIELGDALVQPRGHYRSLRSWPWPAEYGRSPDGNPGRRDAGSAAAMC